MLDNISLATRRVEGIKLKKEFSVDSSKLHV